MKTTCLSVILLIFCSCTGDDTYENKLDEDQSQIAEDLVLSAPNPLEPINENGTVPEGWNVYLDNADETLNVHAEGDSTNGIFFVNMTPGWHITTRPAAIFHHPGLMGEGEYEAETAIHLFDPGERRESFGIFIGGQDLDSDSVSYDYFLIRQGGEFLVKRRTGAETSTLLPWTAHEAVMSFSEESGSSQLNTLAVDIQADSVHFKVNEVTVASLPADQVNSQGSVGLRVNHALNLHVSDVAVN